MIFSQKCDIHIDDEKQMTADQFYLALQPVHKQQFSQDGSWIKSLHWLECDFGHDIVMMVTASGFYFFRNIDNLYQNWISSNDIGSYFQQSVKGVTDYQDPEFYPVHRCRAFRESGPQCQRLTRHDYCWQH